MQSMAVLFLTIVVTAVTVVEAQEWPVKACEEPYMSRERTQNGVAAAIGRQPWLVAIYRPVGITPLTLACEGVLINRRYVITAAQCVKGVRLSSLTVRLGDSDIDGYPHEDHRVRSRIVHENFTNVNGSEYLNDIALLEIAEAVAYAKHILPVCLPEKGSDFSGERTTAFGWGPLSLESYHQTPSEQEIPALVVDNKLCNTWPTSSKLKRRIPETSLCARLKSREKSPCRNGSPLISNRDGRAQVIGVSSGIPFGRCGALNVPIAYTNIAEYRVWINMNMKAWSGEGVEAKYLERTLDRMDNTFRIIIDAYTAGIFVFAAVIVVLAAILKELFQHDKSIKLLTNSLTASIPEQRSARPGSSLLGGIEASRRSYGAIAEPAEQ